MNLWVFLYSNFSPKCKELVEIISNNDIASPFTMLCIDDKNLRERVKNSKDFVIKYVPCILNVDSTTGIASQYEGDKAFELIYNMIQPKENKTPIENIDTPVPQVTIPKQDTHTNIEDLFLTEDDTEQEEEDDVEEETVEEVKQTPLKKKINLKDIEKMKRERENESRMKIPSFNETGVDLHTPPVPIKSKKTGPPIKVADVMTLAGN